MVFSVTKEIQHILHTINNQTEERRRAKKKEDGKKEMMMKKKKKGKESQSNELKVLFSEYIDFHAAIKQLSTLRYSNLTSLKNYSFVWISNQCQCDTRYTNKVECCNSKYSFVGWENLLQPIFRLEIIIWVWSFNKLSMCVYTQIHYPQKFAIFSSKFIYFVVLKWNRFYSPPQ